MEQIRFEDRITLLHVWIDLPVRAARILASEKVTIKILALRLLVPTFCAVTF